MEPFFPAWRVCFSWTLKVPMDHHGFGGAPAIRSGQQPANSLGSCSSDERFSCFESPKNRVIYWWFTDFYWWISWWFTGDFTVFLLIYVIKKRWFTEIGHLYFDKFKWWSFIQTIALEMNMICLQTTKSIKISVLKHREVLTPFADSADFTSLQLGLVTWPLRINNVRLL